MIDLLKSIANAIKSIFEFLKNGLSYVTQFFSTVGDATSKLIAFEGFLPTWVGIFAIASIFVAIIWIVIEVI